MNEKPTDQFWRLSRNCRCAHCDEHFVSVIAYRIGGDSGAAYVGLCHVCRAELERFRLDVSPTAEISYYRPTNNGFHSPLEPCCNEDMPRSEVRLRALFALFPRLEQEWDIACR
jgi:hypothetical protein